VEPEFPLSPPSSRFAVIERRIADAQQLREEYESRLAETDRPEELLRFKRKIKDCERLLREFLEAFLRMCTRLGRPVPERVNELAAELLGEAAPGPAPKPELPPEATPAEPASSVLPGVRVVQISISQLFRMADLLTVPDSVKARDFLATILSPDAMRRAINRRKAFQLGSLGSMRPVAVRADPYGRFWAGGVPDLRLPGASPLSFLPFELSLSSRLAKLGVASGSPLEEALEVPGGLIENRQVEGRLRIYPPGTGVIQLSVTLGFRDAVDIDAVGRVAQNLEDLLFVDPGGHGMPVHELFIDIIDQVAKSLFLDAAGERRWQPPHTVFSFRDTAGFDPEPWTGALARLMALAPGNEERTGFLDTRLRAALGSAHWRQERTLAVAGQGVALLLAALEPKEKRLWRLSLLAETRELVSAAAYAEQAFIEDLDRIVGQSRLDATWLPGHDGDRFAYLSRFLDTMRQMMQAAASIRSHLQSQPVRLLFAFARDVWNYGSPIQPTLLRDCLRQLAEWYRRMGGVEPPREISDLQSIVESLSAIESLFPYPDEQEDRLFDKFGQIYDTLREEVSADEVERGFREAGRLSQRLGL
jgi:hypothetical protein